MASETVDVVICGSGSAGLTTAIWLARFNINFKVLERRSGPLEIGQADGVQCRTVEIFENLGIAEDLLKESYHVMEVAFWSLDNAGELQRTHIAPDVEVGLSHQPHVILNQARINELMMDEMTRLRGDASSEVVYGCPVTSVRIVDATSGDALYKEYPVEVVALRDGKPYTYRAKYAIGCDGAHSTVRKSLGFAMVGDTSDSVWGVMDAFPITNFPDIRKKVLVNAKAGNLMIIPREGDELVRFYIELSGKSARDVTKQDLLDKIQHIFEPYQMDIAHTADQLTEDNRIFLTGDAYHTHSPKAGQGMNVSLQDDFNIRWKMAHVLIGRAPPEVLETYVLERQQTAQQLIDFDCSFTRLFSTTWREQNDVTADKLQDKFVQAGRYTAGMATLYSPSILTRPANSDAALASGLTVGMRFPSNSVVRFSDARPMQLNQALPADGRWHVLVFCSHRNLLIILINQVASALENVARMVTREEIAADSVINPALIIQTKRSSLSEAEIPRYFLPTSGKYRMTSLHRVFIDEENPYMAGCGRALSKYGIDAARGAVVIVRPDVCKSPAISTDTIYVAQISALEETVEVSKFFERCLLKY
ncbi:FAD binding domain-containing protein [Fusarium oxysporum Fo47]|uniref:FAD binding domain-containing protein n=1 Tax=Fusarium oxysporum Fo47 TaxID=660027 RepID=UPI002869971F|nr:FAD binding domain-containing protein [Fusarium oxysporum Fo47]QKD57874.2 FAD binding domain-domain-containing protein [Fusarium oxysporum Fo47]